MSGSQFRRYTELEYLLSILREGKLAVRDTSRWDDKNDRHFLDIYKIKKDLKSVLVLCFAEAPETYNHWKIYAGKKEGVCIGFNKERLIKKISNDKDFVHDYVAYKTIKEMRKKGMAIDDLPFVKRYAYSDEQEYRIVYKSDIEITQVKYISIFPEDIEFIEINPWADGMEVNSIKHQIKKIAGFENTYLRQSTVTDNSGWKRIGENAVDSKRKHYRRKVISEYRG